MDIYANIDNTFTEDFFMKIAIKEAEQALKEGEIPVGAIVVSGNTIIGRGHNQTERLNDVTAHAEIIAITAASGYLGSKYLKNCRLFVTLEPCAMCAAAINSSQLSELVYAASDPKEGYQKYSPDLIHQHVKVKSGIMAEKSTKLLKDFFTSKRKKQ